MKSKLAILLLGIAVGPAAKAACDQTLSPGANVAGAIANAPAGSTVCLNAGTYDLTVMDVSKTSRVFVQSASGRTATVSLDVLRSSNVTFQNLTISSLYVHNLARNISVLNSTFKGQAVLHTGFNGGAAYGNANILIDGNTFDGISVCTNCYEGRIQVISGAEPCGITISNNHIGGGGESDGIQVGANGLVIGPGNVFDGIVQGSFGRHVDSIQLYGSSNTTIKGNYFRNNTVQIMAPDGGQNEIITNNVFIGTSSYSGSVQLGSQASPTFTHNTLVNVSMSIDKKTESTIKSSNAIVRDNLYVNSGIRLTDGNGLQSCTNCVVDSNMFTSGPTGTRAIVGTPTFTGGASPTTWAGYKLASTSLGYGDASDGTDMGSTFFGSGTLPSPTPTPAPAPGLPAPQNLRILSAVASLVRLQFDYSETRQSGFIMSRKVNGGAYSDLSQAIASTDRTFSDPVQPSTTYCYKVRAVDASSSTAQPASNEVCATTPAATVPSPTPTPAPTTPSTWSYCADEGGFCSFTGTRQVRYGADGKYVIRTLTGGTKCENAVFGDPIVGIQKKCELDGSTSTAPSSQNLFGSKVPASLTNNDGVNYELGMRFKSTVAGKITAIRFYKAPSETGTHTGKIYSASGALLAQVVFSGESASGWQQMSLPTALAINANTEYTVAVTTGNKYYVITVNGMATQATSTNLRSVVGSNGVYGPVGRKPTSSWNNSNYFRDIVFVPN